MALPEGTGAQWGLIQPARITEGITGNAMKDVLNDAAAEAEQIIVSAAAKGTVSGTVQAAQMRNALAGIEALNSDMWSEHERLIHGGMFQQAQLAADQALDLDLFTGMPGSAVLQYAKGTHWQAAQVVDDLISRNESGYVLADRIYANGLVTTKQVGSIVNKALILQTSARDLAKQVESFYRPDVPGGASYAAKRLARTEINNAHHATTIAMSADKPWVNGFKWNLSRSHGHKDECDALAEEDRFQMGKGIYPKSDAPDRPHPQCICYLTHEMMDEDEFIDNLVRGDYDDHLMSKGVSNSSPPHGMSMGASLIANEPDGLAKALIDARVKGKSWKQIADEFGYANPSAVRSAFKKATGIDNFKVKGPAVKDLFNAAKGVPNAGKVEDLAQAAAKAINIDPATPKQLQFLDDLIKKTEVEDFIKYDVTTLSKKEASELIDQLQDMKLQQAKASQAKAGNSVKSIKQAKIDEAKDLVEKLYGGMSDATIKAMKSWPTEDLDNYLGNLKNQYAKKVSHESVQASAPAKEASQKVTQPFKYKQEPKPSYLYDGDVLEDLKAGKTYAQINSKYPNLSFDQIDEINWNRLLEKNDGDVWKAFKEKPTSQRAESAVKSLYGDAKAAGQTAEDILKNTGMDKGTLKALEDGTWKKSHPGTYSYQPPVDPSYSPPPPQYSTPSYSSPAAQVGRTGTNFPKGNHNDLVMWNNSLGQDLTGVQFKAIKNYTGSGYYDINTQLRNGGTHSITDRLDKVFRPVPEDMHVVRGTRGNSILQGRDPKEMVGTVFEDKGYMSTSVGSGFSGDLRFMIDIPRGTPARYVDTMSTHQGEKELLLPRGTKFMVEGVKQEGGYTTIYMKVIEHGVTR